MIAAAARRRSIPDFFTDESRRVLAETAMPAVRRDGFWEGELAFRHFGTGEPLAVLYNIFPVRDPTGAEAQKLIAGLQGGTLSQADVLVDVATTPGAAAYLTRNLNATSPGAGYQATDVFAEASTTPAGFVFRG